MELRTQQLKLAQLRKYLPTLQLKKAMLQAEVEMAELEIQTLRLHFQGIEERVARFSLLFTDKRLMSEIEASLKIESVVVRHENIAGIDIPVFENVLFKPHSYTLFDTPPWLDSSIEGTKQLITAREKVLVA